MTQGQAPMAGGTYTRIDLTDLWGIFLRWYLLEMPRRIIDGYVAYAKALTEAFSFLFLLRTLFSPWKSITDAYPTKGFNLEKIAETFAMNCTTRMVGAVIRLGAICAGVIAQALCLAAAAAFLALWLLYPVLLVLGAAFVLFGSVFA